jgi:hypothetical protein
MDKIKIGDLFEINTPRGNAYLLIENLINDWSLEKWN